MVVSNTDGKYSFSPLAAISPLDGRYHKDLKPLSQYVSEYALIKFRLAIEVLYLLSLADAKIIRKPTAKEKILLQKIVTSFTIEQAESIKEKESKTKHDVKAMELFLREQLQKTSLVDVLEMIHFGLTSEDVNNLSIRMMIRNSVNDVLVLELQKIQTILIKMAKAEKATIMPARTHGQYAVPTTLGKELAIFIHRIEKELELLTAYTLTGKVGGAVGNLNALTFALPSFSWQRFLKKLIESLDLQYNPVATQINPYDDIIAYFQILQRINNILLNLSQDMWRYISDGWFAQEVKKDEVGSSTMPQKVNPIFFENAEGNFGLANTLIDFFTRKLAVTRLQRDLSDSTVSRNFGMALGYSLIAYQNIYRGLKRVTPDRKKMEDALNEDWSTLTEAAQTVMRLEGVTDAYMLVKNLSRGKKIGREEWQEWVATLPLSEKSQSKLASLTPATYIGNAVAVTENIIDQQTKQKK